MVALVCDYSSQRPSNEQHIYNYLLVCSYIIFGSKFIYPLRSHTESKWKAIEINETGTKSYKS